MIFVHDRKSSRTAASSSHQLKAVTIIMFETVIDSWNVILLMTWLIVLILDNERSFTPTSWTMWQSGWIEGELIR
jgi:hypothetical protein